MKTPKILFTMLTVAAVGTAVAPTMDQSPLSYAVNAPSSPAADTVTNATNAPTITAKAAFLLEANSGTVLFAHNADQRLPIASMTKVATLGVIYDALAAGTLTMDELITVSDNAASMGGSQAFLDAGSSYTVRDLIQSIVVASANDSCVALAEHIAGSVANFVSMMNQWAQSLGCQNTNFVNCTGLPTPGAYACARDMATMYQKIMQSPHYADFNHVWLYDLTHPSGRVTGLTNTNKLIKTYPSCLGGKTGFTNEAGHCITVAAKHGDLQPIAVIIGASDSKTRFRESAALLDYAGQNFTNQLLVDASQPIKTVNLKNAVDAQIAVYPARNYYHLTAKNTDNNLTIATEIPDAITAPLAADTPVGTIYVLQDGKVLTEIPVQTNQAVPAANYWQTVQKVVRHSPL